MSKKPEWHVCSECGKQMQRCKAASVDTKGDIVWVCRKCWADYEYDAFFQPSTTADPQLM